MCLSYNLIVGDPPINRRTSDSCIKNRCVVDAAMNFFHLRVLPNLQLEHIKELAKTPFLHLFCFPVNTQVNNPVLYSILLKWDAGKGYFLFKDKQLKFTANEVAMVLGLSTEGSVVVYNRRELDTSGLRRKYFKNEGEITRSQLEAAILQCIDKKVSAADIVGLLVMYLFTTVLFPQACGNVPIHMFRYAEDINRLRKYNWSEGVFRLLMENIPNNAIWCQMRSDAELKGEPMAESPEVQVRRKKSRSKKCSGTLPGCALALIVSYFKLLLFSLIS